MAYPQSFIEELKMRNDLVSVIGKYVQLKPAGSNYSACCPFHSERTPSFVVFPEKNFYCFGCGAGGDVITFIMRIENLDYRGAIEYLADRSGIPVPKEENFVPKKKEILTRERNFEMNTLAARYFHSCLLSEKGRAGLDYLTERRLSPATIRHFGLGFAPDSYDELFSLLTEKGFTFEEIRAAFLCGVSKTGKPYDYFRNRVIFPIIDTTGKVIAFGGRVMDDSKPKYLNSSDTPVFKKSRNLFALNFAKGAATGAHAENDKVRPGEMILCEGYMDVIALHQAGFTNAVATLGTAVTPEQARIISRYAKTLYVSYDSDDAGRRADERAIRLLGEVGVEVKVLKVNGGAKDPDEYIKKYGSESFRKLMNGASGEIDYKLSSVMEKYNLDIPEEKLAMLNAACDIISDIYSEMQREVYVLRLSDKTGVSRDAILSEIRKRDRIRKNNREKNLAKKSEEALRHFGDRVNPDAMKNVKGAEIEERILGILLLYPEYFAHLDDTVLSRDDFITAFSRRVYDEWKKIAKTDGRDADLSLLNESFTPEEIGRIHRMYRARKALSVNDLSALCELCAALKKEKEKAALQKPSDMSAEDLKAFLQKKREQNEKNKN